MCYIHATGMKVSRWTWIFSLPQYMVFPHFCPIQFVGQCLLPNQMCGLYPRWVKATNTKGKKRGSELTTTPKRGGLNGDPKRVEIMNCYLTAKTLRSQRNDLPFCFSLRRRKAKSVHLRWVGFIKAMSCSIIAYCGLLQPQFQLPSGFPSPLINPDQYGGASQRRWKKISSSAFSAPRAKPRKGGISAMLQRAVMSYSRTYPHSKAGTISIAEGLMG